MAEFLLNLFTVMLGSGASLAVAQIIVEHKKSESQRRDASEYLAVRLAFEFEAFAVNCAETLSDHSTYKSSSGHAGNKINEVPPLPELPENENYQLLDRSLLHDALTLPQQRTMAQSEASFHWDIVGDPDGYCGVIYDNTVIIGNEALLIAEKFRKKYNLQHRELEFGVWKLKDYFGSELDEVNERNKKRKD